MDANDKPQLVAEDKVEEVKSEETEMAKDEIEVEMLTKYYPR